MALNRVKSKVCITRPEVPVLLPVVEHITGYRSKFNNLSFSFLDRLWDSRPKYGYVVALSLRTRHSFWFPIQLMIYLLRNILLEISLLLSKSQLELGYHVANFDPFGKYSP